MKKTPLNYLILFNSSRKSRLNIADISLEAQRKRLMDALRCGPITTIEARRNLDILMPAARVHELKHKQGEPIDKVMVQQETDNGKLHRIARYFLLP